MLWLGAVAFVALAMVLRQDMRLARASGPDLTRRRWLWAPLFLIRGTGGAVRGAVLAADWLVTPDRRLVTIDRDAVAVRSQATRVKVVGGAWYSAPFFTRFEVDPGPARITIGHFSGTLLLVEQPPPGP